MKPNKIFKASNTLIASVTLTGILAVGFPKVALSSTELVKVCKEENSSSTDAVVYVNHEGSEVTVKGEQRNDGKIKKDQVKNRLKNQHNLSNSEANSIKDSLPNTKVVDMEPCDNAAGIVVSIEGPTIQSSQLPNIDEYYTIDFDDQSTGTAGFSRTNGTTTYNYGSNLEVKTANQWGGAGGSKFITQKKIEEIRSYTINIDEDQKYFGFWWSAGDPYNKITFKKDGTKVAEFKTEDLVNFIKSSGVSNTQDYYGNPAYTGSSTGHLREPFSFVNVFFKKGAYDEIVVATLTAGGSAFESDNHTFSAVDQDPRGEILPNATTSAAVDDTINTDEDSSTTVDILANDVAPSNDISITKVTINGIEQNIGSEITLASGALLKVESNGQTTYNPNNKFEDLTPTDSHSDTFTYSIVDANGNTDTADVTIQVKGVGDAPVATDDVGTTDEDTSTEIDVLSNDNDPDSSSDQLFVSQINGEDVSAGSTVNLASGASVTLNANGTLTYDPSNSLTLNLLNDGDTQDEVFSYTVSDEYDINDTGDVTVTVDGVTDTYAD
ncbi:MAG: Ig-like domain-containing protein [Cyanobacteria bacterium P01_G01_bin.39]